MFSFDAVVYKVQTLADGGIRVTFDLPEYALVAVSELMRIKRDDIPLRIGVAENHGAETDTD